MRDAVKSQLREKILALYKSKPFEIGLGSGQLLLPLRAARLGALQRILTPFISNPLRTALGRELPVREPPASVRYV
jgi:hypothetical protein